MSRSSRTTALFALAALAVIAGAAGAARPGSGDADRDGYPDALELRGEDRDAFADWFAAVAESQAAAVSPSWPLEDRDCSGLLRFAYRAALEPHDAAWWARFPAAPPRPARPSVSAYSYPAPLVSRSVFRVAGGPYREGDVEAGRLVGRTGARYLAAYSAVLVGRDERDARRGDLLFYYRASVNAYHSMVYLGNGRVVYHTGLVPGGGRVILTTLEQLRRFRDPAFRPLPGNPSFLGFYRWKILD